MLLFTRVVVIATLLLSSSLFASIGKVTLLKGEASIQRDTQKISLQSGSLLEEKDIISTAKDAQIQLIFEDKTVVTLGSESEFKIEEYLNDTTKPKSKFKFNQGTFKTITGNIGKIAPENVTLETKTATIGIRGTIVTGQIGENGDIIGCVQGTIAVTSNSGGPSVVVQGGQQTTVQQGTPPQPPKALEGGGNPPGPNGAPPPKPEGAEDASQTNLQDNTLKDVNDKVSSSSGCPAGSVGTAGRCQPINTSYELPSYWTSNLNAASANGSLTELTGHGTSKIGTDFKHDGTFSLTIDTAGTATIAPSSMSIEANTISLLRATDASTITFQSINRFSIQGFDSLPIGWLQSVNTATNEYVSWGYWQVSNDGNPSSILNFWVAGIDATSAATHVAGLTSTSYTYTGKSIGYVYDSSSSSYKGIDETNNNIVSLKFDFGSGTPINSSSYIQFQTNGTTPEVWKLDNLGGCLGTGTFTATSNVTINNGQPMSEAGNIHGDFYGNQAQALGGSFKAAVDTKTAIGVFKAVR